MAFHFYYYYYHLLEKFGQINLSFIYENEMKVKAKKSTESALITMVQARACLWNLALDDYKSALKKQRLWTEIATELGFEGLLFFEGKNLFIISTAF
jgi:hypothetical protein